MAANDAHVSVRQLAGQRTFRQPIAIHLHGSKPPSPPRSQWVSDDPFPGLMAALLRTACQRIELPWPRHVVVEQPARARRVFRSKAVRRAGKALGSERCRSRRTAPPRVVLAFRSRAEARRAARAHCRYLDDFSAARAKARTRSAGARS